MKKLIEVKSTAGVPLESRDNMQRYAERKAVVVGLEVAKEAKGRLAGWGGRAGKGAISSGRTNDLVTQDAGNSATKGQIHSGWETETPECNSMSGWLNCSGSRHPSVIKVSRLREILRH